MKLLLLSILLGILVGCDNEGTSERSSSDSSVNAYSAKRDIATEDPSKKINTSLFAEFRGSLSELFKLGIKDTIPGHRYSTPSVYFESDGYIITEINSLENAARKLDSFLIEFAKKFSAKYDKSAFLPRNAYTFQITRNKSNFYIINISLFQTADGQLIIFISSHATQRI